MAVSLLNSILKYCNLSLDGRIVRYKNSHERDYHSEYENIVQ